MLYIGLHGELKSVSMVEYLQKDRAAAAAAAIP